MDWSMCKPHARYPLLRTELVYKLQVPVCFRFVTLVSPTSFTLTLTLTLTLLVTSSPTTLLWYDRRALGLPVHILILHITYSNFDASLADIQPMHPVRLANVYARRRAQLYPAHVYRCHVGDVAESAVEFLYAVSFFLGEAFRFSCLDDPYLRLNMYDDFQTDSRTNT